MDYHSVLQKISEEKTASVLANNPVFTETFARLTEIYEERMLKVHRLVLPMNPKILSNFKIVYLE